MTDIKKEIVLDAVTEAVAQEMKEPEFIKLKAELELAWESTPDFGLAKNASAEEVAEKAVAIGEHAASLFPGVVPPPVQGIKFMLEKAVEYVTQLRDYVMFTQEIENEGKACAMYTDTNTIVRAIVLVMAVHMLVSYHSKESKESKESFNTFRYFTVLASVVSQKVLKLSEYSYISKEVLQQRVEDAKSKIILN